MNKIKLIYISCVLIICSCGSDFLEIEPQQSVSISIAVTDLNSLSAAVNGVYSNFQDANLYGWDMPLIADLRGDNAYISSKNAGRFVGFDDFDLTDQCGRCEAEWLDNYEVIVNASNIINRFPDIELLSTEEDEAASLLGQVHGLRALAYWNLTRTFAKAYSHDGGASLGVAINNAGTTGEFVSPARSTVAEVYEQVIADLTIAIDKTDTDEGGRISRAASQAILAKVFLYQEKWDQAELIASAIIDGGTHFLYADGATWLGSWGNNIGSEDLFVVVNTPTDNLGVNSIGGIIDQDGYGDVLATEDLYNSYSDSDVRKSIMIRGNRADGEVDALFPEGKYPNGETGDDYIKVIRLADVYLIRAEARARMGEEAGAIQDLTAVASRVNPDYTAVTLSGDALIEEILEERRRELAFEGDRAFDLSRTKKSWTKFRTFDNLDVDFNSDRLINPIPRAEMDVNPNMVQNNGY